MNENEEKSENQYEGPFESLEEFDKFFLDENAVLNL